MRYVALTKWTFSKKVIWRQYISFHGGYTEYTWIFLDRYKEYRGESFHINAEVYVSGSITPDIGPWYDALKRHPFTVF
jgi:hypothetical protein